MSSDNFSPAREGDEFVFGASRPGYCSRSVPSSEVKDWCRCMRDQNGIKAVVCLLPPRQLEFYDDLMGQYCAEFGEDNVVNAPAPDYEPIPVESMVTMFAFLRKNVAAGQKVVVHCSAGMGRTGLALTCWNAIEGNMGVSDASRACRNAGGCRNPKEYYGRGQPKLSEYVQQVREALQEQAAE